MSLVTAPHSCFDKACRETRRRPGFRTATPTGASRLSPRLLRTFQDACRATFGVELTSEEAEDAAMRLLRVMKTVATVDARLGVVDESRDKRDAS